MEKRIAKLEAIVEALRSKLKSSVDISIVMQRVKNMEDRLSKIEAREELHSDSIVDLSDGDNVKSIKPVHTVDAAPRVRARFFTLSKRHIARCKMCEKKVVFLSTPQGKIYAVNVDSTKLDDFDLLVDSKDFHNCIGAQENIEVGKPAHNTACMPKLQPVIES
jgi:hypothetical protein